MRLLGILSFSFVAILMAACGAAENKTAENAPATTTATPPANPTNSQLLPQFTMLDAKGNKVDLKSFAGKKVFVNLWATWCPPCRSEMPSIEKLHQSVNTENAVFLMIALDNDFETAKQYMQAKGLKLPVYYPAGEMPELFNVRGIPATFIFNESGELIKHQEGSDNYDTEVYRQMLKSS